MKRLIITFILFALSLSLFTACQIPGLDGILGQTPQNNNNGEGNGTEPTPSAEYTVAFDTDAGYEISPVKVKPDETCPAPFDPAKRGYTFSGWYYDDIRWNFETNKVKRDITLKAHWTPINYIITYDLGGGSYDGDMPETYTVESTSITLGTPTRAGYEFLGWTINGVEENEIKQGTTGDIKVMATWFGVEATVLPVKNGAKGIVCFIHDDARLPTMEIFDEGLVKYGLVGDVGFILNKVYNGTTVDNTAVSGFRTYLDNGRWKIVNHSATHNWWGKEVAGEYGQTVAVDDDERIEYEFITSQKMMRELFPGQRVLTFAYPGFSSVANKYTDGSLTQLKQIIYSPTARRLCETHHIGARFYSGGATAIGSNVDWNWGNTRFLSDSLIQNDLASILSNAVKNGNLEVLSFHGLVRDETDPEYISDPGYWLLQDDIMKALELVNAFVDAGKLWNTHYEDAILYLREAETAKIAIEKDDDIINLTLTDEMDDEIYDAELTVSVSNIGNAEAYRIEYDGRTQYVKTTLVGDSPVLNFNIVPDKGTAVLTPISLDEMPE